jgi:hypothetical protein
MYKLLNNKIFSIVAEWLCEGKTLNLYTFHFFNSTGVLVSHAPAIFVFSYFSDRILWFLPGWNETTIPLKLFWNYKCVTSCSTYLLIWHLTFCQG